MLFVIGLLFSPALAVRSIKFTPLLQLFADAELGIHCPSGMADFNTANCSMLNYLAFALHTYDYLLFSPGKKVGSSSQAFRFSKNSFNVLRV